MLRAFAAGVAVLAFPAAAQAATASVYVPPCSLEQSKYGACYPDEARFVAAPGEQNTVTVAREPSLQPKVTIADSGAPLNAGAGCTQVDAHTATCSGYNVIAKVDAGDGDDSVSGDAYEIDGGPGNDALSGATVEHGGPGDDTLKGAAVASFLDGGPGRDNIAGGPGNDTIVDPASPGEQDIVDGGDGTDTMSYAGRKAGMTVSLEQPLAGEDRLSAIESLRGGDGNDVLTGDAGPNLLDGGPGRDELAGGDGSDTLDGGTGADSLDGGAGADKLSPGQDKARNQIVCGPGADRADPMPNTLIAADCERIGIDDFDLNGTVRLQLPLRGARAPLLTIEPLGCIDLPCSVRLRATAKRMVIGSATAIQRKRHPKPPATISMRLSQAGAKALKRPGHLEARIDIATSDGGERSSASFLVALS